MVFNDTSGKTGAIQFIESLCKLGDGGITNDTILFKQITAYFNQSCKKVGTALLRVDKNWKWDDSNYTDFPIATINLVSTQRDYTLPASTSGGNASTLWKINKVEILGTDSVYKQIEPADTDDESPNSGLPIKYRLIGNSIRLDLIPLTGSVTMTAGLRITFQRSGVAFTTSSTTEQPAFMDAYHDSPCYDTASAYLMPLNTQLAINYSTIFDNRLRQLQADYALRNDDTPRRLKANVGNNR